MISYSWAPVFIMSIEGIFSLLTRLLSEDFITHVTHHAALPMPPQRRHFCIEMQASTISTGPLARRLFISRRASDTQLLLAHTGHKVFVRTTHCHIMLARTIIQRADLFPHCRDHFVRNATRLTHRIEFPCYVGDIQPLTVYPTIPLVLI